MEQETIRQLCDCWPIAPASVKLVAERENTVYSGYIDDKQYAIRFHRKGLRSAAELNAEMQLMSELSRQGVSVPAPLISGHGNYIEQIDGQYVDLITWLNGSELCSSNTRISAVNRAEVISRFGREMGKLHLACDHWDPPGAFSRPRWDIEGLLGNKPLWGKFWEGASLTAAESEILLESRNRLKSILESESGNLDAGLIHADLVGENVLVNDAGIAFIDFDDCGWGFRLFDIATTLAKLEPEPDYAQLETKFLSGYREVRPMDTRHFPLFRLIRACSYLGWAFQRPAMADGSERIRRYKTRALRLARDFLASC